MTKALALLALLHGNSDSNHEAVRHEFDDICTNIEYEKQHTDGWKALITPCTCIFGSNVQKYLGAEILSYNREELQTTSYGRLGLGLLSDDRRQ